MIELHKVTKTYGRGENAFQALKGIDLQVDKGEFVAIMGPSGSGKSTLMHILGALDQPTTGRYMLRGQDVGKLPQRALAQFRNREVGFVFQQFNLLKKTSVYDNVALPGLYGGVKNLDAKVQKVLEAVGLKDKQRNMSNALSGGQIQRVAVARALLMDPAIIMADEPTGNLDSKTSYEIMSLFSDIHQQGNTVILITHEPDIAAYASRVVTLKDGEVLEDKQQKPRQKHD